MHFVLKYITLTVLTLSLTINARCQVVSTKVFSVSDDASSSKILSLIKHSKGFLIAGTANGLFRFDGHSFQSYKFDPSIKSKAVSSIAEVTDDTTWIGFQTGEIGLLINNTVELLNPEEGYPKVAITSILKDIKGTTFFATAGEGIYYYKNKRFYNINTDDGLSDNYVYDIKQGQNNSIVAATDHGVNICSINNGKKQVVSYAANSGIPDNIVRSLTQGPGTRFLIGMQDAGFGFFDIVSHTYQPLKDTKDWSFGQINSIIDTGSEVWVGTESNGLVKVGSHGVSNVDLGNLPFKKVNHLLSDDEGGIWFTSNNRLVRTSGVQLQKVIPLSSELSTQIHSILSDRQNGIWINYNHGLKRYTSNNNEWKSKDFILPLVTEKVDITSLYQDKYDNIWIGTMGKGIMVLDPKTGRTRSITEDEVLIDGSILSINGRDNNIWISSLSGPIHCKLSNNNNDVRTKYTFNNYNSVSGIGSNYVYSILPDGNNRVWFATDGKGLTLYQNGKFTNYSEKSGLKSKVIYNICEDPEGNIWFSTLNAGLYKFNGKTFTNISTDRGLNDPTVTSLSTDNKGNILAVTKKGINIIDRKNYSISYIDANDGIRELNTDPNCIAKTTTQDALFVTSTGIISFNASYSSLKPKIVLDNVQLFLNDISFKHNQKFSHDENNISLSFSGISLSHPDKIQYQYQLRGLSNEWITTKDTKINFPKLSPGNYTFIVRASLNNNFTNSPQAIYSFKIGKPFWLQWWFISLSLVVIALFLYWFVKSREKRVKRWGRLEKERIQSQFETLKSQVNPHFLFNSFNTLISVIEESPGKAVEYVEHLSDLYRKIVTYRDKDLISLAEELELINDYYFIQKKRFGKNLLMNADINEEDLNKYVVAPLTLQLLAENAVKHNAISCETPLAIHICIVDKFLMVRNNINPKITNEKGAGMGLQNIQNRYKLLATDDVKIERTEKEFIVSIPLIKANT